MPDNTPVIFCFGVSELKVGIASDSLVPPDVKGRPLSIVAEVIARRGIKEDGPFWIDFKVSGAGIMSKIGQLGEYDALFLLASYQFTGLSVAAKRLAPSPGERYTIPMRVKPTSEAPSKRADLDVYEVVLEPDGTQKEHRLCGPRGGIWLVPSLADD